MSGTPLIFIQIHRKMAIIFLLIAFAVLEFATCQTCPSVYQRFSQHHTMCLPRNNQCNIVVSGVPEDQKKLILQVHNTYRSYVANGKETRNGGFPSASAMMQMEWDDELSKVAQKWASNCLYQHDCNDCRQVENFGVGQNIAFFDFTCPSGRCAIPEKDWRKVLKAFYDEIDDFPKRFLTSMQMVGNKQYGHFTQMIWGKTWRIGCGYVLFKYSNTHRHFYVCDYGPGGNILNSPVYDQGMPCSGCPTNSCCDKSCRGQSPTYAGLCKMLNVNQAPIYANKEKNLMFFCDFNKSSNDCRAGIDGIQTWSLKNSLEGSYISITLKGGQSSTLRFHKKLEPSSSAFCVKVMFRKGPLISGPSDRSTLKLGLLPENYQPTEMDLRLSGNRFSTFSSDLSWGVPTQFSLTFSVPPRSPDHILDIKEIKASNGHCSN